MRAIRTAGPRMRVHVCCQATRAGEELLADPALVHLDFLRRLAGCRRLDEHLHGLVLAALPAGLCVAVALRALALVVRGGHGGRAGGLRELCGGASGAGGVGAAAALTGEVGDARAPRLCRPNAAVRVEDHAVDHGAGPSVGPKEVGRSAGGARWVLQLGSRGGMRIRAPASLAVVAVVFLELVVVEEVVLLVRLGVEVGVRPVACVGGCCHAHWGMSVSVRLLVGIRKAVVCREGESRVGSGRMRHCGQGRDYVRQLLSGVGLGRRSRPRVCVRHPGFLRRVHEHRLILILWVRKWLAVHALRHPSASEVCLQRHT